MALKVKAKEREMKIGKNPGIYRYVMLPELYSTLDQEKVINEAAIRSGVTEGVMRACWEGAGKVIKAWATEGHSVALPGLGTMRFGLRAKAVEDVNDVKASLIKTRRIIFTPMQELKDELATVEDPENGSSTGSETETGGGNGSETGGGSNDDNNDAPPVINPDTDHPSDGD